MISFKWFSPESICSILMQLAGYSLMIQGQQSFAHQQDKVAACERRYKHCLTSLESYEYASKTKQLQDTVIVGHAVTNVSLTVMMLLMAYFPPFLVCGFLTTFLNYLYVSCIYTVRWWMLTSSTTSIKNKQEGLKDFELWTLDFVFSICNCCTNCFASLVWTLGKLFFCFEDFNVS